MSKIMTARPEKTATPADEMNNFKLKQDSMPIRCRTYLKYRKGLHNEYESQIPVRIYKQTHLPVNGRNNSSTNLKSDDVHSLEILTAEYWKGQDSLQQK